jgi:hypothetical protein
VRSLRRSSSETVARLPGRATPRSCTGGVPDDDGLGVLGRDAAVVDVGRERAVPVARAAPRAAPVLPPPDRPELASDARPAFPDAGRDFPDAGRVFPDAAGLDVVPDDAAAPEPEPEPDRPDADLPEPERPEPDPDRASAPDRPEADRPEPDRPEPDRSEPDRPERPASVPDSAPRSSSGRAAGFRGCESSPRLGGRGALTRRRPAARGSSRAAR